MTRRLLAAAATTLVACSPAPDPPAARPAPTTTEAPPTTTATPTTTLPPTTRVVRRRVTTTVAPVAPQTAVEATNPDDAFWLRLSQCECASGRCGGTHVGYFQFSRDTARKVGIDGSEPYEEQRAAAEEWARRIHPREGTSAGWPHCWWEAA